MESTQTNLTRYRAGQKQGHYESFFLRANHKERPWAFWIRYTLFSPENNPERAIGELWAVYFDGDTGHHVVVKKEVALTQCTFSPDSFSVRIQDARLEPGKSAGSAATGGHHLSWDMTYSGMEAPLFLMPLRLYQTGFPKAKSLVSLPMAVFNGYLAVDNRRIDVVNWVGSQNHNWGVRHTDHYAWGQVAGFDTHPDSFLEVATARIKAGPFWSPFMTLLVHRYQGQEIRLNGLLQMFCARGSFSYFVWVFRSENREVCVDGTISTPKESFVGLHYLNPPGGSKHCLNTKIASCELRVTDKRSGKTEILFAKHRAAFEILTDDRNHGIDIRA